jgi:GNAT superfamily N-acetyltransferase
LVIQTQEREREPLTELRAWRTGDEVLLARAGRELSPASLYSRFLGGLPALPPAYLRLVAEAPRWRWDGHVAVRLGCMIGWAEFARMRADATEAELALVVLDAWQRRGIGSMLVRALLPQCRAAGVSTLYADVAPSNFAARAALKSWFLHRPGDMTDRAQPEPGFGVGEHGPRMTARLVDGLIRYTLPL